MNARLALWTGQSLDGVTFALVVTLIPVVIVGEQNPLAVGLYGFGGVLAVAATKIGATGVVCWVLGRRDVGRLTRTVVAAAALVGFAGAASNLFALWQVLEVLG